MDLRSGPPGPRSAAESYRADILDGLHALPLVGPNASVVARSVLQPLVLTVPPSAADSIFSSGGPPFFGFGYSVGQACGQQVSAGQGGAIAKPIARPAAVFNPHLHPLLACRNPYLTGEHLQHPCAFRVHSMRVCVYCICCACVYTVRSYF